MSIEGLEVLLIAPDFATPPRFAGAMGLDQTNLSEAPRINTFIGERPLHSFTHKFRFTSRADAEVLEDFFDNLAGKWGAFWLPSWHAELSPAANLANADTALQITPCGYATIYDPTDANVARLGHYIFLVDYDGTFFVSKVLSAAVTGGTETLTLETAAPKQFTYGRFFVGFLYCVRSMSDDIALTFSGMNNIETELSVTELMRIDNDA